MKIITITWVDGVPDDLNDWFKQAMLGRHNGVEIQLRHKNKAIVLDKNRLKFDDFKEWVQSCE